MTLKTFTNIVQWAVVAVLLGFLGWQIYLVRTSANYEYHLALAGYAIVGLFVLGVITENVGRVAVKGPGGTEADMGNGNAP